MHQSSAVSMHWTNLGDHQSHCLNGQIFKWHLIDLMYNKVREEHKNYISRAYYIIVLCYIFIFKRDENKTALTAIGFHSIHSFFCGGI